MKTLTIYSLLLLLFVMGCSPEYVSTSRMEFQTKDEFLDYLMEGYLKGSEPLYLLDGNGGRLEKLYKALGLKGCDKIYTANRGELLIFDEYEKHRDPNGFYTLVLSADAPPKLIRSPDDLWNGQCRVFHYSEKEGLQCLDKEKFQRRDSPPISCRLYKNDYLKLYNGYTITGNTAIYMDEDTRFLCYRKLDKQLKFGAYTSYESEPIYIISVDNPKMTIQSRLKWFPDSMVINNNRLYLGTITERKSLPLFHFEVFDIIGDNELKYLKDYYVDVPWEFALHTAYMFFYDHRTNSQYLSVVRNFPFSGSKYLYCYNDNRLKRMPDGLFRFIDPAILKNSVQYIDINKLKQDKQ